MTGQLEQLLGYLQRDGVTEILFGSGRPIAMRSDRGITNITARPLTDEQFSSLLRSSNAHGLIPPSDGESDPVAVEIGSRRALVRVARRGNEIVVSLRRPDAVQPDLPAAPTPRAPMRTAPAASVAQPAPVAPTAPLAPALEDLPHPGGPGVRFGARSAPAPAAAPRRAPSVAEDTISIGGIDGSELTLEPMPPRTAGPAPVYAPLTVEPIAVQQPQPFQPPHQETFGDADVPRTFDAFVTIARQREASDLHLSAGRRPMMRVAGVLVPIHEGLGIMTATEAEQLLTDLLDPTQCIQLRDSGYVDFARQAPTGGRLRANISRTQQGLKGTFRLALETPKTLEQLGLPVDLAKVVQHHQGLVIVAGPSGQGKTTTLAALVDLINSTRPHHILTIEDPIEIVHPRKQAVVSQREAGSHTASFARGLKASLREDPDVIVIGELRDRDSVEIALTAAETGHLVITTMSTPSASKTIDRLIDMFPADEQNQVRASIAGALRAIIAQRLLPKRGGGIVPTIELVTGVLPLAVLIRDDKLYQLPNLLQRGKSFGMIRFDESLLEHVRAGRVDEDVAIAAADSKKEFTAALRPAAAAAPASKTSQIFGFGKKDPK